MNDLASFGMSQENSQADAVPQLAPPPYYWIARMLAERRVRAAKCINEGVDKACDEFFDKLEAMPEALGLTRQRDPKMRLGAYYAKPDLYLEAATMFASGEIPVIYSWESQEAYFPRDYQEDMDDFQKLRERAIRGDFGGEFQGMEIAYRQMTSQQQLMQSEMMQEQPLDDNEVFDDGTQPLPDEELS